jgi:heme oxygenase
VGVDYVIWLVRFLGLYDLLESLCSAFPQRSALDVAAPPRGCAIAAAASLGTDVTRATRVQQPETLIFARTLDASYGLEGAALGGRVIQRNLGPPLGASIAGVTRIGGGSDATRPMGQSFRLVLDSSRQRRLPDPSEVVPCAQRTFRAQLTWLAPLRGEADATP